MAILLMLDVIVGFAYSAAELPSLLAGAAVAGAVVIAARRPLLATCAAAVASLAVTYLTNRSGAIPLAMGPGRALPGMTEVAGLALLMCVSLRSLPRAEAVGAVTVIGAAFVGVVDRGGDDGFQPLVMLAVALVASVAAGTGVYLRWIDHDRRRDVGEARESERLAIARELHDVVAHHVTGIVVQAQAAQAIWDERPAEARTAVAKIEAAGSEALRSMRRLVETLRTDEPASLAPTGTIEELHRLAAHSASLGLPVRLHLDGVPDDLSPEVAASVHRIVGEAIINAQRHATGATGVDVHVDAQGNRLTVQVEDDGRPMTGARQRESGYGVIGMAERTEALGGTFRAGPREDSGWLVEADLPLAPA